MRANKREVRRKGREVCLAEKREKLDNRGEQAPEGDSKLQGS